MIETATTLPTEPTSSLAAFLAEFPPETWRSLPKGWVHTHDVRTVMMTGDDVDRAGHTAAVLALFMAAPVMLDAMDPNTLEAIADEIDSFENSARAGSLRYLAKRQRAAIAQAEGRA